MERVAFLIEETGLRIGCMLNPEGLVVRRAAGVRRLESASGQLSGAGLTDDPLIYTGGGRTEIQLDLLFDVSLAGSNIQTTDVREMTAPLWQLAENAATGKGYGRPPLARFVWGKAWNILGVVTAVSERFDRFTATGEPQRSWLRMRFVRVSDPSAAPATGLENATVTDLESLPVEGALQDVLEDLPDTPPAAEAAPTEFIAQHEMAVEGTAGENLPDLAERYLGDPSLWRLLAWFNNITDPLNIPAGTIINVPPLSYFDRYRI